MRLLPECCPRGSAAELVELGDEDAAAYTALMAEPNDATRARIVAVPEAIASHADEVVSIALRAADKVSTAVAGDAEAAVELARAAARVARGPRRAQSLFGILSSRPR